MNRRSLLRMGPLAFVALHRTQAQELKVDAPSGSREALLQLAARNIANEIGIPPSMPALIVCSKDKCDIAEAVAESLEKTHLETHVLRLGTTLNVGKARLQSMITEMAGTWGLIFLLQPEHAGFLFETVGRPDLGLKLPGRHLFSDWLIRPPSLLRTYGIEMDELRRFRQSLLSVISPATEIHVTTRAGTNITTHSRSWNVTNGEVFTAPVEDSTNGTIYVDGCAYGGPPARPFMLRIERGRVKNVSDLLEADEQQRWVRRDLTRDENSNVLAELGIGINPGARWNEDLMESEQARGTCHFGFGHNLEFGGRNQSSYHFDLVVRSPSIEVDGKRVCNAGEYSFGDSGPGLLPVL